jgi:acyl-CoA thioester hydrolase
MHPKHLVRAVPREWDDPVAKACAERTIGRHRGMNDTPDLTRLAGYPHRVTHAIRYGDTDRQGHVNNAVYAVFFEFGRTLMLAKELRPLISKTREPVVARLTIEFKRELHWPGDVEIGTGVVAIGTSSARFGQAVFSGDTCVATGEAVIVQLDSATRKATPWEADARVILERYALKA